MNFNTGEFLNYKYWCDKTVDQESITLDNMLAKQQYFEKLKVYETNHWQVADTHREQF